MKKKIKFYLKMLFGVAILVFLFSKTSVREFVHLLLNADYKYFVLALILYVIGQVVSARKWMVLSQRLEFENSFKRYLSLYFLGMFYNMFLPTNIGGDIIKVTKLNDKRQYGVKRAIISVLSDRITGVCVLVFFILFGFLFYANILIIDVVSIGIIFSSLIFLLAFIYVMKNEKIIPEKYKNIYDLILLLLDRVCLLKITAWALIFHMFLILIHYCIAQMYNLNIPFSYYLLLYPLTAIVASLPLSINGIGLKEFVYVYMLKPFNIDTSTALLFAMTFNMVVLFASTIGFIPYISKDK